MRPATVEFLGQCIRAAKAVCSALEKWVRHTQRSEMSEEIGQVTRVVRVACASAEHSLNPPQPSGSAAQGSADRSVQ